ncbi:MAG TPA: methylmalonyl-CoA mutase family protein [Pirellulales bacterium]|nr:methylmalonyl-CoA mutase family protein [Pirellulales bacterium]
MTHDRIREQAEAWNTGPLAKTLSAFPERCEQFQTASGLPVERLYLPGPDVLERYEEKLGFPGSFPFTRGVQPTMYRGRLWTMRQYAGFSTAEESNRRYRYLLSQGSTGLSIAFDLPTQLGLDSDHPMCFGEVGKVGVAINTLADMEALFEGIPLDKVSTSMTINATAPVLLAMYVALAEKQGVEPAKLEGTVQNDILKEYAARGAYIFPPQPSLRLIANIFQFCGARMPKFNTISISGYHIREAGATAVQEVAFTLADAICYIETALRAGLKIDDFAPRLTFFFAAHNDFFEEIAKFRAARRLYAKIMKERFQAQAPKSMMLRFHTQTGGVTLTAQEPDNNVVRVAWQTLAAVLGGTQSLHANSKDEALALPSESSAKLALRTQQLIAYESGVTGTVDPLGGSFYVENLTDRIESEAARLIDEIDSLGGMPAAIESGYVSAKIEQAGYDWCMQVERKERIVVGVNEYAEGGSPDMPLFEVGEEVRQRQIDKLNAVKARRDPRAVKRSLAALKTAADDDSQNVLPSVLDAVRAYATVGEICDVLRQAFGEYEEKCRM